MQAKTLVRPASRARPALKLADSYDLLLCMVLGMLLPGLLLVPFPLVRVPLGLAAVLFMPGYVLAAALFSRRRDADQPVRIALSLGLSLALIPPLALLLDKLPWGIRPWPIAIAIAIWTVTVAWLALLRRRYVGADADLPAAPAPPAWWRAASRPTRGAYALAALAVAAVLAVGFAALLAPDPRPTEFYALGAQGLAEDYPRAAVAGEPVSVTVGVVNDERAAQAYRVEVWARDGWSDAGGVQVLAGQPLTLAPGERVERPLTWAMLRAGDDQRVDIVLFREGDDAPYRQLRLWLNVAAPRS